MRHSARVPVVVGGRRTDSENDRRRTALLLAGVLLALLAVAWQAQAAWAGEARVTIAKVNQGGNAGDQFGFVPSLKKEDGTAITEPFQLAGGQQQTFEGIECNDGSWSGCAGDYTVTEQPAAGYDLESVVCTKTDNPYPHEQWTEPGPGDPVARATLSGSTVTIKVAAGEWVKCVFTNAPKPPTPPQPPPPAGTTPPPAATTAPPSVVPTSSPQATVKPSRASSGRASLSRPSGCIIGPKVAVSVRGKGIARVTFWVDGRRMATVTRARQGRYSLVLDTRKVKVGSHRVTARVWFKASAATRSKTLRTRFLRCGTTAVSPSFTG
jgi:hypothetical protein